MDNIYAPSEATRTELINRGLAPPQAQIAGLHDTFHTAAILTGIALLLSLRACILEKRLRDPVHPRG